MVAADEDALRCDFAQTYHILDYRRLPLRTAAVFAWGLGEDSRVKRALFDNDTYGYSLVLDKLGQNNG